MRDWTQVALLWQRTGDGEWPYCVELDRHVLRIRVNDFPAEPLYTLFVDDERVTDLEDWPDAWIKPPAG